jgi:ABC-type uncharacterized transport system ATPase subunit
VIHLRAAATSNELGTTKLRVSRGRRPCRELRASANRGSHARLREQPSKRESTRWVGPNRRALARDLGVVFGQRSQLSWDLPRRDSFRILAAIHRLEESAARRRTDHLVAELGLTGLLSTPVRQLSLGERMRGGVAAALVHSPRLLVLDESTTALT